MAFITVRRPLRQPDEGLLGRRRLVGRGTGSPIGLPRCWNSQQPGVQYATGEGAGKRIIDVLVRPVASALGEMAPDWSTSCVRICTDVIRPGRAFKRALRLD